ncbi:MAG TPA: hypothetical protein VF648_06790 [Pyrinomonadaceae bacterium]
MDNPPVWLAKSGERLPGQLAAIPVDAICGKNNLSCDNDSIEQLKRM